MLTGAGYSTSTLSHLTVPTHLIGMGVMAGTVDQELRSIVGQAASGDEVAFGRIVAAYHAPMYCVCMAMCRDRALAEEAVEAAWTKVWRCIGSIREPERLRPWVISVAANEARQLLRKRRRRSQVELAVDPSDRPGGIDPAAGIARMDLRAAMDRLAADERALLTMRYVLGFDATELSMAIGITPAGVRQRLSRLLARLRQELA